ncbi:hypothetical protein RUND412_001837 [Rhizina undulata]
MGGVTAEDAVAEPLPPLSPTPNSDDRSIKTLNEGENTHSIIKVSDDLAEKEDDVKSESSDNERVREKLKKTSLANVRPGSATQEDEPMDSMTSPAASEADVAMNNGKKEDKARTRKRSFDETDVDDDDEAMAEEKEPFARRDRFHERKRSREISDDEMARAAKALNRVKTPPTHPEEDEEMAHFVAPNSTLTSPKKLERKRSRDKLDEEDLDEDQKKKISKTEEEQKKDESSAPSETKEVLDVPTSTATTSNGESSTEKPAETKAEDVKIPPTSGFANFSSKSPFATTAAASKPLFGAGSSSGNIFSKPSFGAMSGSAASPFGALGASNRSSSPFGALGAANKSSGFGSTFGGGYSGFGSLAAKSVDVISSAPKKTGPIGGAPAKPFGAPDDDDKSDDDGSDDGSEKSEEKEEVEKKEVFHEQEVVTGEEDEVTIFKCSAKIFSFDRVNKAWKERGRGVLKLNKTADDYDSDSEEAKKPKKQSARLIMRTEGTYTLVLNVQIFKGMRVGDDKGNAPTNNQITLVAVEATGPVQIIARCKSQAVAKELYENIRDLQRELFE